MDVIMFDAQRQGRLSFYMVRQHLSIQRDFRLAHRRFHLRSQQAKKA